MAWIESHQELARHPKTKRLARATGITTPAAIGHLHLLWWWALDYAQSGELTGYTDDDIADAACWDGDPVIFTEALVEAGFIDRDEDALHIHDWQDYAGRLLDKREQNRERMKRARASKNATQNSHGSTTPSNSARTCGERAANVQETNTATVPNRTVPNQPNQQNQDTTPLPPTGGAQKDKAPQKTKYADFVSMTNDEYSSLVAKLGEAGAARCIEILDNYKGANGKKYKSDYRAILNWVVSRYEEEQPKAPAATSGPASPFLREDL